MSKVIVLKREEKHNKRTKQNKQQQQRIRKKKNCFKNINKKWENCKVTSQRNGEKRAGERKVHAERIANINQSTNRNMVIQ